MEWTEFEDWCLGRYRKAKATVYYNLGRLQSLQRAGLQIDEFMRDPNAQERERNRIVGHLKRQGRSANSIRTYQKAMNWLVDYARYLQPEQAWARGELEPESIGQPKSVAPHVLEAYWRALPTDDYNTRLERAIAWTAHHMRGRRGEIQRLRDEDLNEKLSCIRKEHPSKRGAAGWLPMPTFFWDDDKPLKQYLAVRVALPGSSALWRKPHGNTGVPQELAPAQVYICLRRAGQSIGHPLNFIRTRRGSSIELDDGYNVHPRVGQFLLSHNKQESWSHYVGRVTIERAVQHLQDIGVPGFENHPLANGTPPEA